MRATAAGGLPFGPMAANRPGVLAEAGFSHSEIGALLANAVVLGQSAGEAAE
jgi:hypothetical protein